MNICHKCKNEVVLEIAIGRLEECPHCTGYLHCCLNCEFHDPGAQNECREPLSAYVRDRTEGNFCNFWRFKDTKPVDHMAAQAARMGLKSLFGGAGPKEVDARDPRDKLNAVFKKQTEPAPSPGADEAKARLATLFKKKP